MNYNCVNNQSKLNLTIIEQLLSINNTYNFCELIGNTRLQNKDVSQ